jgi:hypothetical protein
MLLIRPGHTDTLCRGDNYSPINRSSGGLQYGTSKIFKMLLARG